MLIEIGKVQGFSIRVVSDIIIFLFS